MKKCFVLFLCILMVWGLIPYNTFAASSWPADILVEAEGCIVMDADTGAVLYGQNIHQAYFPASITKLMTALLVMEHCEMDEMVTFSERAVTDVEEGSKSLGMVKGDSMNVKDCLYGLLLHSSNETANALAEHVAGSIEDFADMMNAKAAELGCKDTHFANPSGLNNPKHYTSAYDMALIGQAVMDNEALMVIDSSLSYRIPPSKRLKEGQIVYPGHKMLKKSQAEYYPSVIGGKTGYTSLAGNTLVTFAEKDGLRLVVVILNGHLTHYADTKTLLDFGFRNFHDIKVAEHDTFYTSVESDLSIAGLSGNTQPLLTLDSDSMVTLPLDADFSDLTSELTYEIPSGTPADVIATVQYSYDGRLVGTAYLKSNRPSSQAAATASNPQSSSRLAIILHSPVFWGIGLLLIAAALCFFGYKAFRLYTERHSGYGYMGGSRRKRSRGRKRRF